MELKQCGRSGLYLSVLGLGTLTWGRDTDGPEAHDMLTTFVDAGGNLVECSPTHGDGIAVDVLSEALASVGRHRVALAWRGAVRRAGESTWVGAAGRGDLLRSLDDALARLDTDYVDVWLVEPQAEVPLEETLEAATLAYRSGRARYVGLSRASHWQLAEAVTRGVGRFCSYFACRGTLLFGERVRGAHDRRAVEPGHRRDRRVRACWRGSDR